MSAPRRSSDLTILVAAGVATVLLSIVSFIAAPVESLPPVDGSSYAAHPQGARAAYLALKAAGYRVERSFEPLTELARIPSPAVVILADPGEEPSQLDVRALRRFVEEGGVVLATGQSGAAFLPGAPTYTAEPGRDPDSTMPVAVVSPFSRGVPEVRMTPAPAALAADSPFIPVYGDAARPSVIAARHGGGRAVWWSASTPLTNDGITRAGHAELLANVLGSPSDRLVLWDEHYHGHTRSLWSYVAGTPVPFAGLQLVIVFVAALLSFSRRRWPLRRLPVEPRTSPLEFVDSMGALYERAGTAAGVVETVRARVRRTLVATAGLPSTVPDDRLGRAVAGRTSMEARKVEALLTESARAGRDVKLRPEDARSIVAALQELGERVHGFTTRSSRAPASASRSRGDVSR